MKKIRYLFEAAGLYGLFLIFRLLPLDAASGFGGWLGRTIGPRLAASRKARRNLKRALPGLGVAEQNKIIRKMWDNLGRVISEYPHLEEIVRERTAVKGQEYLDDLFASDDGAIFISAHFSNWEILAPLMRVQFDTRLDATYRPPNNPWIDTLLQKCRSIGGEIRSHPKSRAGGKSLLKAARNKRYIGILIDQKYNEGLPVPFFGRAAMTNPVFVQLSQKFGARLIPVQNKRLNGARFEITVHEPLPLTTKQGEPLPADNIIQQAHQHLETWIKENPGQWLWLHRRWDSEKISDN